MLGISYSTRVNLYNALGCYKQGEIQSTTESSSVKRTKIVKPIPVITPQNALILSFARQEMLHNTLKSKFKKDKDGTWRYTIRPDILAHLIMGKEFFVNILDPKTKGLIVQRELPDVIVTTKSRGPDESWMFNSIVSLRRLIRNATSGNVVRLIIFDSMLYRRLIPDYISQLMTHFDQEGHLHIIRTSGSLAVQQDYYYLNMFRYRYNVYKPEDVRTDHISKATRIPVIQTNVLQISNDIQVKCFKEGIDIASLVTSKLHFTGLQTLRCFFPLAVMHAFVDLSYKDLFKLCMMTCMRPDSGVGIFQSKAVLEMVTPSQGLIRSEHALNLFKKIDAQLSDITHSTVVNIVMIGNKGEGKSIASHVLGDVLERNYKLKGKVYSSDSYGRWLQYICDKYGVSDPNDIPEEKGKQEIKAVTQESEALLDRDDVVSWFEIKAEEMMLKADIVTHDQIISIINSAQKRKLAPLKEEFNRILIDRFDSKSYLSYGEYMQALSQAKGDNQFAIFECHTTEEAKLAAKSDITFVLEPISSGLGNILERSRGSKSNTFGEILLYEVYADLIGKTYAGVYLSELLQILN